MKIDLLTQPNVFETLAHEWNALLHRATTNTLFLTLEWQKTWWQSLGSGELRVITFRQDDGALVGVAPLFIDKETDGHLSLSLIGCVDVSDYLDVIVARGFEEQVYRALLDTLTRADFPAWDTLDLCTTPAASPTNSLFKEIAQARGLNLETKLHDVAPFINLPDDWDAYLATLEKKQRHEIRRKLRRVEEANTRWYVIESAEALPQAIADFVRLHKQSRPDKNMFMDTRMETFFARMAQALFPRSWLQLAFLEVDGARAATILNFVYDNDLLVYNSGYDPVMYGNLSPGIVLFAHSIQDAIAAKRRRYDFLRGDEEYKYRFGARDAQLFELHIWRGAG